MDPKFYRNPSEPGLNFIKIEEEFALAFFSYEGSIAFQKIEKPNLIFDKITDIPINDPIYDEIKTEYNSVIKKMYSLQGITLENNQVSIINERREKVRYIPKNVSYRIRLDLLEY